MPVIAVIGIFVVFLALWVVGMYNALVRLRQQCRESWSVIDTELRRRYDLIPNLVETVKAYARHEREVLQALTEARARAASSTGSPSSQAADENALVGAMRQLYVVVERYPDLKANQNFIRLQDELAGTENRIAVERMRYNEAVRGYNVYIRKFPNNIAAGIFGFTRAPLFEAPEEAKQPPKVQF